MNIMQARQSALAQGGWVATGRYQSEHKSGSITRVSYYNQQKHKMTKGAKNERWKPWVQPTVKVNRLK